MHNRESFFVSKIKGLARLNKKIKRPLAFLMLSAFFLYGLAFADAADFLRPRAAGESSRLAPTEASEKPPYERLPFDVQERLDRFVITRWALNYPHHLSKEDATKARNILARVMLADELHRVKEEKTAIIELINCFPEQMREDRLYEDVVHIVKTLPILKGINEEKLEGTPLLIQGRKPLRPAEKEAVITKTFEQPDYYSMLSPDDRRFIDRIYPDNGAQDVKDPQKIQEVRNILAKLRSFCIAAHPEDKKSQEDLVEVHYESMNNLKRLLPTIPGESRIDPIALIARANHLTWETLGWNGLYRKATQAAQQASTEKAALGSI